MQHPVKTVIMKGKTFRVAGISKDDPYFSSISDDFESEFSRFCTRLIAKDYVCIDIGANIGLKTLLLSQHVPDGKIIAIEANPKVGSILAKNVEASGQTNITVVQTAVGDTDGFVHFAGDSAYGHIAAAGVEVPVQRLASIIQSAGLDRADFIKIDVEGFEFPILRDSLDLINQHRSLVLFEFNSWCQIAYSRISPLDFLEWIFAHFSFVARIDPKGTGDQLIQRLVPGQELDVLHANMMQDGCVTDLLVTNDSSRLVLAAEFLQQTLDDTMAQRDAKVLAFEQLKAERDEALAQLNAAKSEVMALLTSHSWTLTAPLRRLASKLGLNRR